MRPLAPQRVFTVGVGPEVRGALAEMAELHEVGTVRDLEASFVHDRILSARPQAVIVGSEDLPHGALKLLELLKGDPRTRAVPALLLFERGAPRSTAYCINLGFDDVLVLERDREGFAGRVRAHIAYKRRYDEFAEGFEREFETVLGSFGIALVSMDLSGAVRFATRELGRLLETPVEEIEGRPFADLAAEDHAERAREAVADLAASGVSSRVSRLRLRVRGGEPVYLGLRGLRLAGEDRIVLCLAPAEREVETTLRARESQSLLRRILRAASEGVLLLRDGRVRYANAALRAIFGYARDEMLNAPLDAFLPPDSRDVVRRALSELGEDRTLPPEFDVKALRKDGGEVLVSLGVSSVRHQGETVILCFVRDVTERRREAAELRSFKDGLDQASDVVARVDALGRVVYVNRAVESYGFSPEEVVGRPFGEFVREPEAAERLGRALAEGRAEVFEAALRGGDGRRGEWRVACTPILGPRGERQGAMWMLHDVSAFKANQAELLATNRELRRLHAELAESNRRLDLLSRTDELTGIANRRHFDERLQEELARAQRSNQPFSLLLMDLDNFKRLNDTQGHQRGDEALAAIAQIFRKNMRETDMIARSGGDEFVVLLPSTGRAGALIVAEKLRQDLLAANPSLGLAGVEVSISVGAATLLPPATMSGRELFNLADAAMYRAKARGGNRVEPAEAAEPGESAAPPAPEAPPRPVRITFE